jgi:hypothetical protein
MRRIPKGKTHMAFSGNNPTLYNACVNGYIGGALSGRAIVDTVTSDYSALEVAAAAFAAEVDAQIAVDATLTTAGTPNTTIAPVAGNTTACLSAKSHLMFSLCYGYWAGRLNPSPDPVVTDYLAAALAIKAAYNAGLAAYAAAPGGTSLV